MNERGCLYALQKFVLDNEATLVSGLVRGNKARTISRVTISKHVPPISYIHVACEITSAVSRSFIKSANIAKEHEGCLYSCYIHIVDVAGQQKKERETHPFERMTVDFREFVDRLVELLRATGDRGGCFSEQAAPDGTIPVPASKFRIAMPNRTIEIENRDAGWEEDDGTYVGLLYAGLKFSLEEGWAE